MMSLYPPPLPSVLLLYILSSIQSPSFTHANPSRVPITWPFIFCYFFVYRGLFNFYYFVINVILLQTFCPTLPSLLFPQRGVYFVFVSLPSQAKLSSDYLIYKYKYINFKIKSLITLNHLIN